MKQVPHNNVHCLPIVIECSGNRTKFKQNSSYSSTIDYAVQDINDVNLLYELCAVCWLLHNGRVPANLLFWKTPSLLCPACLLVFHLIEQAKLPPIEISPSWSVGNQLSANKALTDPVQIS